MVVEVNNVKLTEKELEDDINSKLIPIKSQFPENRIEQIKAQMRDRLIDNFITRIVISQEAEKQKLSVSEKDLNSKIDEISKSLPQGMTLENALKMNGMKYEDMRKDIKFNLIAGKLFDSNVKVGTQPSEEEIKKYYSDNKKNYDMPEQVHARHILIKTDEKDTEKTKAEKKVKLEALKKQLIEGANFAEIAKNNSDCPSKANGGDLGTFSRGNMVKPFEDAAFSQKVNEIGNIIETKFGYHIIQTLEHNQAKSKSFDEVKSEISEKLLQQKKQKDIQKYLEQLKEKAKIVYGTEEKPKKL
jgi:peptidyl-prolyl cis-trans isomerase C